MIRISVVLAGVALFTVQPALAQHDLSFFVTSSGSGKGADLGGLDGADRRCHTLAYAVGYGDLTWRAYLSAVATADASAVNARDRIGNGPWYNTQGTMIGRNVADLHSDNANLTKQTILTEKGNEVNGRGDRPNTHDFLTGSNLDGTVFTADGNNNCNNWTSSGEGSARVGHHDRQGGGQNPNSWNSAHGSRGCSQANLQATGGNGYYYCFAIDGNQDVDAKEER